MPKTETKILEKYVLGILDISLILEGVFYLFYKEWLIGFFLIVMSFFMTNIVMSLKNNRNKSNKELANRTDLNITDENSEELTTEEADEIGRAINQAAYILATTAIVMLFHYDIKWYFAIPIGFIIGVFLPPILLRLGMLAKK